MENIEHIYFCDCDGHHVLSNEQHHKIKSEKSIFCCNDCSGYLRKNKEDDPCAGVFSQMLLEASMKKRSMKNN